MLGRYNDPEPNLAGLETMVAGIVLVKVCLPPTGIILTFADMLDTELTLADVSNNLPMLDVTVNKEFKFAEICLTFALACADKLVTEVNTAELFLTITTITLIEKAVLKTASYDLVLNPETVSVNKLLASAVIILIRAASDVAEN